MRRLVPAFAVLSCLLVARSAAVGAEEPFDALYARLTKAREILGVASSPDGSLVARVEPVHDEKTPRASRILVQGARPGRPAVHPARGCATPAESSRHGPAPRVRRASRPARLRRRESPGPSSGAHRGRRTALRPRRPRSGRPGDTRARRRPGRDVASILLGRLDYPRGTRWGEKWTRDEGKAAAGGAGH